MSVERTAPDIVEQLRRRVLNEHGNSIDWTSHWNLTVGDSLLHKRAAEEIERLRSLLKSEGRS